MLLFALLACGTPTSPDWLATRACQGMPGLVIDAAGRAYLADAVDPAELALWEDGSVSPGIRALGVPGYGVIRANLICTVDEVVEGPDGVRVRMTRSENDLSKLVPYDPREVHAQERVDRPFEVEIVDTPRGPRARVGLARARAEAEAARALGRQGDEEGALAAFDALYAWFPDPMIAWEKEAVRAERRRAFEHTQLDLEWSEDVLWLVHAGEFAVAEGTVILDCGGVPRELPHPALQPGDRVALLVGEGEACALTE